MAQPLCRSIPLVWLQPLLQAPCRQACSRRAAPHALATSSCVRQLPRSQTIQGALASRAAVEEVQPSEQVLHAHRGLPMGMRPSSPAETRSLPGGHIWPWQPAPAPSWAARSSGAWRPRPQSSAGQPLVAVPLESGCMRMRRQAWKRACLEVYVVAELEGVQLGRRIAHPRDLHRGCSQRAGHPPRWSDRRNLHSPWDGRRTCCASPSTAAPPAVLVQNAHRSAAAAGQAEVVGAQAGLQAPSGRTDEVGSLPARPAHARQCLRHRASQVVSLRTLSGMHQPQAVPSFGLPATPRSSTR